MLLQLAAGALDDPPDAILQLDRRERIARALEIAAGRGRALLELGELLGQLRRARSASAR